MLGGPGIWMEDVDNACLDHTLGITLVSMVLYSSHYTLSSLPMLVPPAKNTTTARALRINIRL